MTQETETTLPPLTDENVATLMLLGEEWRCIPCRGYYVHLYRNNNTVQQCEVERTRIDEKTHEVLPTEEVARRKATSKPTKAWYQR